MLLGDLIGLYQLLISATVYGSELTISLVVILRVYGSDRIVRFLTVDVTSINEIWLSLMTLLTGMKTSLKGMKLYAWTRRLDGSDE